MLTTDIEQTFQAGLQSHKAGMLPRAEQIYRQILSQQPNHAEAMHYLGLIAFQAGKNDSAVELISRAIGIKPDYPGAYYNLAEVLRAQGQIDKAISAYRQAIALKPNFPEAYCSLGITLGNIGQLDDALNFCRQAIALNPKLPLAFSNIGHVLQLAGQYDDAIVACQHAISLSPNFVPAYCNLGNAFSAKEQFDQAIIAYRKAISLKPDESKFHYNLGNSLREKGQLEPAIDAFRKAVTLDPRWLDARTNLGNALKDAGRLNESISVLRQVVQLDPANAKSYCNLGGALRNSGVLDQALAAYQRSAELDPSLPEAQNNLGTALNEMGEFDQAAERYHQSIALRPDYPEAHCNLAHLMLLRGNFARGWEEYEWRRKCADFSARKRKLNRPEWDGGNFAGSRLLITAEQGLGDTFQFIRYLPMVRERGGDVIIECQPPLQRLLAPIAAGCTLVAQGSALPEFDLHCPLLSLPRIFGTTLATIPNETGYLSADPALVEKWARRLTSYSGSLKVGLVWAGRKSHRNDLNRSIPLSAFSPIVRLPNISFHSLQKGDGVAQITSTPVGMELIDWTNDLTDFAETAALIENLDLVISVDTSVAHLAGAMGKPGCVLLPCVPDWRWMLGREDSPWYPTLRLFRQRKAGEWESVMRGMAAEFADCIASAAK